MARVVRSSSSRTAFALVFVLAGCAHDATPLPPESVAARVNAGVLSDPDRLARCEALHRQIATLRSEMTVIREAMSGHRAADQVGGYFAGLLFPPVLLVADQQTARKAALDQRQTQVDQRLAEEKALRCPSDFSASR
jgi:hypothetical protein